MRTLRPSAKCLYIWINVIEGKVSEAFEACLYTQLLLKYLYNYSFKKFTQSL